MVGSSLKPPNTQAIFKTKPRPDSRVGTVFIEVPARTPSRPSTLTHALLENPETVLLEQTLYVKIAQLAFSLWR